MTKPVSEDASFEDPLFEDPFSGGWRCLIILTVAGLMVHLGVTHGLRPPPLDRGAVERIVQREILRDRQDRLWPQPEDQSSPP